MADGSIILDTRINNKGAYAELKELQAKAKSTAQQVAALDRQINTANSKHLALGKELSDAQSNIVDAIQIAMAEGANAAECYEDALHGAALYLANVYRQFEQQLFVEGK